MGYGEERLGLFRPAAEPEAGARALRRACGGRGGRAPGGAVVSRALIRSGRLGEPVQRNGQRARGIIPEGRGCVGGPGSAGLGNGDAVSRRLVAERPPPILLGHSQAASHPRILFDSRKLARLPKASGELHARLLLLGSGHVQHSGGGGDDLGSCSRGQIVSAASRGVGWQRWQKAGMGETGG